MTEHAYGVDWSAWSLPIVVGWGALMVVLERRFPYDPGQRLLRVGLFTDLFWYTIVQSALLGVVIAWIIAFVDRSTGLSRLALVSRWPVWAQLAFFWVTHDLYIYAFHRLQHGSRILWRTHEAHHSVRDVDFVAGSRSHPLEILINQTIEYAPIVLLGAHPDVAVMKGILDATWGMWIHSNVRPPGWASPLQYVLNGPEQHRWHHSAHFTGTGFNFATKIALWDWLFGTAYNPSLQRGRFERPEAYGLAEGDEPFPEETARGSSLLTTYFAQIAHAFRREPAQARARAALEAR